MYLLVVLLLGVGTQYVIADEFDWPRWRGPNGDGISLETEWNPKALSENPKILWKTNVGMGYSNVAIKDNYLYTMGYQRGEDSIYSGKNIIYCLNAETGEEVWRYSYESDVKEITPGVCGTYTTPTVEDKYVYTLSVFGHVVCLKAKNGKLRWEKNIVEEYGVVRPYYGFAGSPVIEGGLVLVTVNQSGLALDKKTGKKVWISEPSKQVHPMAPQSGSEYATPVIYNYKGTRSAAVFWSKGLSSVNAKTGELQWFYDWKLYWKVSVADPIIFDNKVFISCAYDAGCELLDISGNEPKVLWKNNNMINHFSTCVLIDGHLYGCDGSIYYPWRCTLTCLDTETGDKKWSKETGPVSLIVVDNKLIVLHEKGTLYIVEASPTCYQEISSFKILDQNGIERWWTHPVLLRGRIYCRSSTGSLVCIDVSK
jgi:outer membrane protein assembly factor BamB